VERDAAFADVEDFVEVQHLALGATPETGVGGDVNFFAARERGGSRNQFVTLEQSRPWGRVRSLVCTY